MGAEFVRRGHKRVVTAAWKYAAGHQIVGGFVDGFTRAGGGAPVEQIWPTFEDVEFQAILTRIAGLKPDAVFVFFAGGGAVKFVKDYDAAIDRKQIPLYGPGFLTDGTLEAQGAAAEGIVTTLHWADTLDTPASKKFMADFRAKVGRPADVYAVQGYDTGSLMVQAMERVKGDTGATRELIAALEGVSLPDSPRGAWRMSKSHNPIQDFYLRRVEKGRNVAIGVAHAQLDDPGTGCKL
jgi:branched-chain amino acid transport system substrate-binding protein